jgi:hypothetical protein
MVTDQNTSKKQFSILLTLLLVLGALAVEAQSEDSYRVKIKMAAGGPAIAGFLYAVNDTAVVLLPSARRSPRGLVSAQANTKPISIPSRLIRKLKVSRARSFAYDFGLGLLLAMGYSAVFVSLMPIDGPVAIVPFVAFVSTATAVSMNLIQSKTFRPMEPGFTMLMQRYCLKKDGLMVDR